MPTFATPEVRPSAVVVDDHADMAHMIADKLDENGWAARVAVSGREAIAQIEEERPDLVITDLRMPEVDGLAVLEAARDRSHVIVMTGFGDIPAAVEAMKRGAWHFVEKPVRLSELVGHARRALDQRRAAPTACGDLVGASAPMRELAAMVARVARTAAPVLLSGESGTGKELVARALHDASPRASKPFVAINCSAIPDALVESELFGHVRGAFTGATGTRRGVFGEADGGTLFLDEIGDMPLATQAKVLRVLQDGEIRAVGAEGMHEVDVRVVAATHHDLDAAVRAGRFRGDLFYRLAVVPIAVPPLRERRGDVALLARYFLARAIERDPEIRVRSLGADLLAVLDAHDWPGNVRELEHLVERLALFGARAELSAHDLRQIAPELAPRERGGFAIQREQLLTLRELEDEYIAWVLERCGANKARAADVLGIDPSTLYRRARPRVG